MADGDKTMSKGGEDQDNTMSQLVEDAKEGISRLRTTLEEPGKASCNWRAMGKLEHAVMSNSERGPRWLERSE